MLGAVALMIIMVAVGLTSLAFLIMTWIWVKDVRGGKWFFVVRGLVVFLIYLIVSSLGRSRQGWFEHEIIGNLTTLGTMFVSTLTFFILAVRYAQRAEKRSASR